MARIQSYLLLYTPVRLPVPDDLLKTLLESAAWSTLLTPSLDRAAYEQFTMSYTGDGVAQTQAFAHARKQLASNDKIAQLEGFTTRVPTDGDKHVSVFSQVL